jgi:hypothetical protein
LGQWFGTVAAQAFVDDFQASNQIHDVLPGDGAARGCAEVSPAPEWSGVIDETPLILAEQRTGAIVAPRHTGPAGGAQPAGEFHRLPGRQVRCFARQAKMTALGPREAMAFDRPSSQYAIDITNLG